MGHEEAAAIAIIGQMNFRHPATRACKDGQLRLSDATFLIGLI